MTPAVSANGRAIGLLMNTTRGAATLIDDTEELTPSRATTAGRRRQCMNFIEISRQAAARLR